jgi:hypothetical protein
MNWLWGGPIVVARYVIPVLILPFPFAAGRPTYVGMAIAGRRWHIRRTVWAFTHAENVDHTELIRDLFTWGELSSSGTGLAPRLDVGE